MAARRALAGALGALAVLASGCGQAAPDLFQVTRSGADRNANVDLVVNDAGSATCNRTIHKPISSEQLIDAREIARDLGELAKLDIDLPKGTGATLHYKARSDLGTVAWWDTSPGQDTTLAKLTRFTKDIAEDVCGLAR